MSQSKTSLSPDDLVVSPFGLTQLFCPSVSDSIVADVVFVHGLQGHPRKTWQYTGAPNQDNIYQHGYSLLTELKGLRVNCQDRPIIFVAHSLGGLLVKRALVEARKMKHDKELQDVSYSSSAIIFFGTPHRGADKVAWGIMLSNIFKAFRISTTDAILRNLDPHGGSSKLTELTLDFNAILEDESRQKDLKLYSFQEQSGMTGIQGLSGKV